MRVNTGQESIYQLTVFDPGDKISLTMLGGLPQGSTLEQVDEGEYVFRWTLQKVATKPLVFIANDTAGASSTFTPIVYICACVNGGNCSFNGPLSGSSTVVMNCNCSEGICLLY